MKVAIIGGGLAGTACAYVLKQNGHEPVIYEAGAQLAAGASGNDVGLYNPRFAAAWNAQSQYYADAFDRVLEVFPTLGDIEWNACGALHLITDEKKDKRFSGMLENWEWDTNRMRRVGATEAAKIANLPITHEAVYLPRSGSVSPQKLCAAYAKGVEIRFNTAVASPGELKADAIILAAGPGMQELIDVPLQTVRGQITYAKAVDGSTNLPRCAVCYSGYVSPPKGGVLTVGSTFQRWLDHSEILSEDDADNMAKLAAVLPDLSMGLQVCGARAAVRTSSRDQFPVVGQMPGSENNMFLSTAHGSHGILSTLMAAHILADLIEGKAPEISDDIIKALSPDRF